ncbi:tyrosine-protein phosphatase non-receptor type 22 isoform X2 [Hemibagrus wyckioides]|uniref:tyrosine-protein phosphatase non-receptor type 22 isoform X2 n=1 Tax=Hemibagrus wyckioides TaxID=337641 RepID=UPI00266BD9E9|nr:tyrosine-protein phosphatase non-receptor type 22 isoform X2 [Hemibagrus wyckioides]
MELQAQLLRSFLTQFASKEATSAHEDSAYAVEFLRLKRQSTKYRTEKTYSTKAADRQENVKKNRYKDIVPFDHSRVKLSLITSKNDTDYINANFIRGVFEPTEYIATQGPLPHTVLDFWRMLWEYNVQVIVMACREFEMGRKKCERYWPETLVDVFVCEPFTIYCESEENKGDYLIRSLKVTFKNCSREHDEEHKHMQPCFSQQSSRTLKQLHYMNWPDHGVPDSIPPILEMLQDMHVFQKQDNVPFCIHCSAGCGRTGVLCVIDYTWNLLKKQMIPEDFNIYDLVQDMRTQRPSIVQTKEQYELVYRAITFLFEKHLQLMESSSKKKEVPPAPPPIPVDCESEISDFSESEEEIEPVEENRLHPRYDARYQEKEFPREFSNHVAPSAVSQPLPPHLQPSSSLDPKRTTADRLNGMKNWAMSKISPRATAASQVQKTDIEYQKSQITKLHLVQETDFGYQKSQTPKPPSLQEACLGPQKSQILEPSLLQPTDLGYRKSQILEPPPLQPTDLRYQKSQTLEPPPMQPSDLGYQKSQILEPPPLQQTDLGYRKSHILEPPPLQQTDLGCRKSQILEPPPVQPTDLGFRKAQIPKPPRIQKTDLACRKSQTLEPPPVQETDTEHQTSQILEHTLLKQTDIDCQKSQTVEPPPIQQTDLGYLKSQIPKPPRPQKKDLGCHNPQIPETATTNQNQHNDPLKFNNYIGPTPVQESSPHRTHQTEMCNDGALVQTPSVCLTVEDPYFGPYSAMSPEPREFTEAAPLFMENPCYISPTLTSELPVQDNCTGVTTSISDDDSPPPLPERTPESYILANEERPQILTPTLQLPTESPLLNATDVDDIGDKGDTANMDVDQSLSLVIPPDTFSTNGGGSPPSPAPPLPERTPESFEMANDEDLLQNAVQEKPQETVLRVGKSSEWSGNSNLEVPDFKRSWSRSKSLKARLSLNVPVNIHSFAPDHIPSKERTMSLTPPSDRTPDSFLMEASNTQASLTPPLPRRTPESYIVVTEEAQSNSAPCQDDTVQQKHKLGMSSEWAGNSQARPSYEVMSRSRSVKVKSSKQDCLSVVPLPDPDGGASAEPVLSRAQDQTSLDSRRPAVEQPEKTSLPKKCRTKSLRLWKGKQKTKEASVSTSVQPNHGAAAGFIFSFGTRFGKPKGPRGQPETWV